MCIIFYYLTLKVCAAIGTVFGIFILEKLWAMINGFLPINQMAEDAVDKMYQGSGMPKWGLEKPKNGNRKMPTE